MAEARAKIGSVLGILVVLLAFGTVLYNSIEGWSFVDSFYFTATTLTTIGYGDIVPTHDLSKLVTVAFALSGVATFLYALGAVSSYYI